jgi:hypothetical protein
MMIAPARQLKIGELLVSQGVLTEEQVAKILAEQKKHPRPFGDLAERLYGVNPKAVERAWLEQYVGYNAQIDLASQRIDAQALSVVSRRQAWQFRVLPMYHERGHLVAATSRDQLRRAVNFAWGSLNQPTCFLIADPSQLQQFLMRHYPWPSAADLPLCPTA